MAVHEVLGLVGNKWSVLTVVQLRDGVQRFNELRRLVLAVWAEDHREEIEVARAAYSRDNFPDLG